MLRSRFRWGMEDYISPNFDLWNGLAIARGENRETRRTIDKTTSESGVRSIRLGTGQIADVAGLKGWVNSSFFRGWRQVCQLPSVAFQMPSLSLISREIWSINTPRNVSARSLKLESVYTSIHSICNFSKGYTRRNSEDEHQLAEHQPPGRPGPGSSSGSD